MKKIEVSVVMPVFNKAPYVRKAVESVVTQSFKDWELIVVDDGSTDGSGEIVREVIGGGENGRKGMDERCRLIRQEHQGVSVARNHGVALAKAELIAFLDADDWWEEMFLEEMVRFAEEYSDAALWASNYWYVKRGKTHVAVQQETGYMDYAETYLRNGAMPVWTGATMARKDVLVEMGGFPAGIALGEDFLLWSNIALKEKIAFLNKALSNYNNDVSAKHRATRNLHVPGGHMVFNMSHLEKVEEQSEVWKALCDRLRVDGLVDYWLSNEYHEAAALELEKVDWRKQSRQIACMYRLPRWVVRARQMFWQLGSRVKQWIY